MWSLRHTLSPRTISKSQYSWPDVRAHAHSDVWLVSSQITRNELWLPDSTQYGRAELFLIKSSINLPESGHVGQQSLNFFLDIGMTYCDQLGRVVLDVGIVKPNPCILRH